MNALTLRLQPIRSLTALDDASIATRLTPSDDLLDPASEFDHDDLMVEPNYRAHDARASLDRPVTSRG